MMNTPTITTTSENIKNTEKKRIASGVCTIVCCIVAFSATNSAQITFPQQLTPPDDYVVSTDSAKWKMYNSGNINLFMEGVSAMDMDLLKSYQKISEIRCLVDNWNGNGASKFSSALLDSVQNIVEKLIRQPKIFPTARESIQLEYENRVGDYLEFELFEDGRIKKFYCSHDGKNETEDITVEMVYEVVNSFYGLNI